MPKKSAIRRNLYGCSAEALARLSAGACERHISQGAYVARLLDLHEAMSQRAYAQDAVYGLRGLLTHLGLGPGGPLPVLPVLFTGTASWPVVPWGDHA